MRKVTAIITARGGSKGIPAKNITPVNGEPLIKYTIDAAIECEMVGESYVTTDSAEIAKISRRYGARVIERPDALAGDTSLSSDAVSHALLYIEQLKKLPDYFVLLQPTSPLRNSAHLSNFLIDYLKSGCDSGISVTEAEHHPWKMTVVKGGLLKPAHDIKSLEAPRQVLPKSYRINGAMYAIKTKRFLEKKSFFVEPVFPFVMSKATSCDIDSEDDIRRVEKILMQMEQTSK